MATITLHATTNATPEQVLEALTDFGPGRQQIFPRSADGDLRVHAQTETSADVTEGSGGVWERLAYDWSDPRRITMTTTDSNTWGGASGHTYVLAPQADGTTAIDVTVVRDGKNLKGRLIGAILSVAGKRVLGKSFDQTVAAIERRAAPAPAPTGR